MALHAPLLGLGNPVPLFQSHLRKRQYSWCTVTPAVPGCPALPKLPEVLWGKAFLVSGDQSRLSN